MIWYYIILSYASLFALGLGDNVRGPLFPEILRRFEVNDTQGALFYAVASFFAFLGSYGVRFILRRWHRLHTLQFSMFMMSVGLIGMGVSGQFWQLLIFAGVFGFSIGVVGVVQNVLVSLGSPATVRERVLAGLHATYGAASLLAPLLVAALFSLGASWRGVFFCAAVVPAMVLIYSCFRKDPRGEGENSHGRVKPKVSQDLKTHCGQIYFALALGFYVAIEIMVSSRLSLFERRQFQVDLQQSSYDLTVFFIGLLAGRLLFTFFKVRWSLRQILSGSLLLSAMCLSLGLTWHPGFLICTGFFMAPFYPIAVAYMSIQNEGSLDSALSYAMAVQAILTVAMHSGVGFLTDAYGIAKALWVGPIALLISFLLLNSYERLFKS